MTDIRQPKKAAFIDRDGVLNYLVDRGEEFRLPNGKPCRWTAPFLASEIQLMPGAREALELMESKGYLRILVTNQPDVATGHIPPDEFERIMDVFRALPLTSLYACMHHPKAGCACRKPKPGMLLAARHKHGVDLERSFMIGDSETDIQAGRGAGVRTMLVSPSPVDMTDAEYRVMHIMEAARLLP